MTHRTAFIDVYLTHERLDALRAALHAERRLLPGRHAVEVPVRVVDPPGLRIAWDWIRPPERSALRLLQAQYPAAPTQQVSVDWEDLDERGRAAFIHGLWEAGHVEEAHNLTRLGLRLDSRSAWAYLDEHCARAPAPFARAPGPEV
jgi:hypothetical protein